MDNLSIAISHNLDVETAPLTTGRRKNTIHTGRELPSQKSQFSANIVNNVDILTGLPDRNAFLKKIERAIAIKQERKNYLYAVLAIDLNCFQTIDLNLGRELGDRLLVAFANKLTTCLREKDFVCCLGGDKFAVFLDNLNSSNYAIDIAERIYNDSFNPLQVNERDFFIDLSIGIILDTENYHNPNRLLKDAELATSRAKKSQKSYYQIFNREVYSKELDIQQLKNDLRLALTRQEFELHYQPIFSLATKQMQGFEALLRWQHPTRGLISPQEFIPIAEETGAIIFIGFWVIKEACSQMRAWQEKFPITANWKISINVSGKQLEQVGFVGRVAKIIQEVGIAPTSIKLEITESCLLENSLSTLETLQELKALGIELSLDDFGTGYSSLSYLHAFPFNTLKIDRSFVNSMEESSEKLGIIRAIVALARNLGMDVISEGIETLSQLAQLKVLNCQYGQGYFFSKPLDKKLAEISIENEILTRDKPSIDPSLVLVESEIAKEQMLLQIENLRQQLSELKQEKNDLEIMLETANEHADLVELQLHQEICDRRKAEFALQEANQELGKLTILDSLTQVANRRRFDEYLLEQWKILRKTKSPLSLILCDVDYFKLYNDTYGHPIGDRCLQQVALAIEAAIESESHLVCRYGGEEFAVILPEVAEEEALRIANNIRERVKSLKIAHHKSNICEYVTMSLGVFSMTPTPEGSPEILIYCADKALYEAKTQGRDRAIVAMQ